MLTAKQLTLFRFIERTIAATDIAPSFDEMMVEMGLRTKSGIHRLLTGLENRGFIRRIPMRPRAIEIVRRPGDVLPLGVGETVRAIRCLPIAATAGAERAQILALLTGDTLGVLSNPDHAAAQQRLNQRASDTLARI